MKSFINKILQSEFIWIAIPFVLWVFCFRHFFTGVLWLQADAISYAEHIGFYTDNLSKGVFPLWDPDWLHGAPYDFFLRRIGDVNPLLFLVVFLKWLGVAPDTAVLIFIGGYYFLAMWAFYLIAKLLFEERFFAYIAYVLLLFSSWGSEIFYNYIIIIFVPIIWFFYFLLRFSRSPQKGYFLGMCFCVGLIVTTYIPFFFLIILIFFSLLFVVFYWKEFLEAMRSFLGFFQRQKIFTWLCAIFLIAAIIPALVFYKESKGGEFVLPDRHSGSAASSAVSVSITAVTNGDIISHGYFDRLFNDHQDIDMGDVYIPYVFFLVLLCTIPARANRLVFFLLFNILALSLITVTSAAGVHRFLYEHIIIFKFIRNIYYFFWLAMLPMGILLMASAFKSLQMTLGSSSKKIGWLLYIIGCHAVFIVFLYHQRTVLWGAWVAVVISLIYFLVYLYAEKKISQAAGFALLLLSVFIQSLQVYICLDQKVLEGQNAGVSDHYRGIPAVDKLALERFSFIKGTKLDPNNKNGVWERFSDTQVVTHTRSDLSERMIQQIAGHDFKRIWPLLEKYFEGARSIRPDIYYSTTWFAVLGEHIQPEILYDYINTPYILYDNVFPSQEGPQFFNKFQDNIAQEANIAFVPKLESNQGDWQEVPDAPAKANIDPQDSGQLTLVRSDANTMVFKTHFDHRQFLVINDNYNSGWHAFINGRSVRLLRANVSFKGLWVPAGDSVVLLRFSHPLRYVLHIALMIFFVSMFVYLLLLLREGKNE